MTFYFRFIYFQTINDTLISLMYILMLILGELSFKCLMLFDSLPKKEKNKNEHDNLHKILN